MSDEPLYCMRCGEEECGHIDGWEVSGDDARFCHTCGCEAAGGECKECSWAMGGRDA